MAVFLAISSREIISKIVATVSIIGFPHTYLPSHSNCCPLIPFSRTCPTHTVIFFNLGRQKNTHD
jgi:hypothetical protein